MRLKIATVATLLAAFPTLTQAHDRDGCVSRSCKARVAHRACDQQHPRQCVLHVIHHARLGGTWKAAWLLRIPACESTWNPFAVSAGGHKGLFQFADSTWRSTPYGHHNIFSAFWQPYAALFMLNRHREGEWACA